MKVLKYGTRTYEKHLKKLGLTVYKRNDPASPWWQFGEYWVAPIIRNGKKIGWQPYYYHGFPPPQKTMKEFETKKQAIEYIREEISERLHPWYEDLPGYDTPQGVYMSDGEYAH